ncbi:conserved protein of unknown function [Denitratisoma oestradiolicum]|uniref:Uncharacterized protein n=1 Tax=Denitratisoma oestradiolicum TaxID=311182 RepID=A0A6S6XTF7_9PROT|nr:hypothetical protein [Denitratisoma oestradiolicum]CAB1367197.1 conserved protein of unknown function [Denitratisoma oestradiolicum]
MQTHSSALAATPQPAATVLDIGSLPSNSKTSPASASRLPKPALQELSVLLAEMDLCLRHAREQLTAALDELYGDAARAQLLDAGKDTGTTHLTDGDLAITVEIKKSVSWDQGELAAIAQRIASNGDDPAEYIDVKYSVSERKFAAWPETLRRPFEAARTLKPAKPAFRLAIVGEGK